MNKNDKSNINLIESIRRRMARRDDRGGAILQVDGRPVEFTLETAESGFEEFRARFAKIEYIKPLARADVSFYDVARGVSDYLTTAELYNVIKAGVNSYIERGL